MKTPVEKYEARAYKKGGRKTSRQRRQALRMLSSERQARLNAYKAKQLQAEFAKSFGF